MDVIAHIIVVIMLLVLVGVIAVGVLSTVAGIATALGEVFENNER